VGGYLREGDRGRKRVINIEREMKGGGEVIEKYKDI